MINLTVGELKKRLQEVPDTTPVYIQRIEDSYFTDEYGNPCDWGLYDKHLVFTCWCQGNNFVLRDAEEEHEHFCKSHYVPAESGYKHQDDNVFVINAHY